MAIGLIDGLITALIIASNAILSDLSISLYAAIRISGGSSMVGATSYLLAEYGEKRTDMVRIARHLNPVTLKSSKNRSVQMRILMESILGGSVALSFGFIGAMIPLAFYSIFDMNPLISISVTFIALSLTGLYMGYEAEGSAMMWIIALDSVGFLMLILGNYLRIFQ